MIILIILITNSCVTRLSEAPNKLSDITIAISDRVQGACRQSPVLRGPHGTNHNHLFFMVRSVRTTINRTSRTGHFVAGIQVKGKGKGLSRGNTDDWTVLMQVVVNAENVDMDPEVEISGGQTRLVINTARHSIDIQADLQPNSEHLTIMVDDISISPTTERSQSRDAEGSSPQDEGR